MREKSDSVGSTTFLLVGAAAVAVVLASAVAFAPREAKATPGFAKDTGKPCGFCHAKPPELNDQGKAFKAKGNKL
jgi:hypothetical protein